MNSHTQWWEDKEFSNGSLSHSQVGVQGTSMIRVLLNFYFFLLSTSQTITTKNLKYKQETKIRGSNASEDADCVF
jgi:hypothetical protein